MFSCMYSMFNKRKIKHSGTGGKLYFKPGIHLRWTCDMHNTITTVADTNLRDGGIFSHYSPSYCLNITSTQYSLWFHLFVASYTDVNECMESTSRCGLGTCINNENGTFYTCNCNDGTISNGGQASDDSLMCVGRLTYNVCLDVLYVQQNNNKQWSWGLQTRH